MKRAQRGQTQNGAVIGKRQGQRKRQNRAADEGENGKSRTKTHGKESRIEGNRIALQCDVWKRIAAS